MKGVVSFAILSVALCLNQSAIAGTTLARTVTTVGSPIWTTVDPQLFEAPADSVAAFNQVFEDLVPDDLPTHTPHGPPYDTKLSDNAATAGYVNSQVYSPSAIDQSPNAVYYATMYIPDPGETGESRDFASGPVIPRNLYPISRDIELYRNGTLVDSLASCCDLDLAPISPAPLADSHVPVLTAVFQPWEFDPTATFGDYELRETIRDSQGNGYDVVVPFTVVPEPSSAVMLLLMFGATLGRRVRA